MDMVFPFSRLNALSYNQLLEIQREPVAANGMVIRSHIKQEAFSQFHSNRTGRSMIEGSQWKSNV